MAFLKNIALALWTKHRKKLMAVIFGLLFAGLASISGIPLDEIKSAAGEAANAPTVTAPVQLPTAVPQ